MSFSEMFKVKQFKSKIIDLENKIDRSDKEKKKLQTLNDELLVKIDRLQKDKESLEVDNKDLENKNKQQKREITQLKKFNSQFNDNIFDLKKELSKVKNLNNEFNNSIKEVNIKNDELINQNKELKAENENKKVHLSAEQMTYLETINKIENNNKEIELKQNKLKLTLQLIKEKEDKINNLEAIIGDLESNKDMSQYGIYNRNYDFQSSKEYKDKLKEITQLQKDAIRNKTAVNSAAKAWTLNGKKASGRKLLNYNIKTILRSFNNECSEVINKVTINKFDVMKSRIIKSYEQHNEINELKRLAISNEYLELKLKELHLSLEYKLQREDEKEQLREQKRKNDEEKKLKKEIEAQKKQINKDRSHIKKAIDELTLKSQYEKENQELQEQIYELKRQLSAKDTQESDLDYRLYNAKAGYVYVISNIGAFGNDIVKIGVTRRLEPMERINELSSASVPFKFDVHAMIFNMDAFNLEAKLHQAFDSKRINVVNKRKEFFKVSPREINNELKKYENTTISFNEYPDADEYRQSLNIINAQTNKVQLENVLE